MATVTINGATYSGGSSVAVINGRVFIDGKEQNGETLSGVVQLEIAGKLQNLKTDMSCIVKGNVDGDVDAGGSVTCHNVGGNVDAGGSVNCDNVAGDVDAGGSVNCGDVKGGVDAGGSIMLR